MGNNKSYRKVKVLRNRDSLKATYERKLKEVITERQRLEAAGEKWEPRALKPKPRMRWRAEDETELRRVVKNFNQKISRLEKKIDPIERGYLPKRLSVKELKKNISTRADFNRELNSAKRFSQKGAEEIVELSDLQHKPKMTNWQRKEMTRGVATVNTKRVYRYLEAVELEMHSGGKPLGYNVGELGLSSNEAASLSPFSDFYYSMSKADIDMRLKHIRAETSDNYFNNRDQMLRDNIIKGLKENFPNEADIAPIIESIQNMDARKLYRIYRREGNTMEFESRTPSAAEYQATIEHLRAKWEVDSEEGE